MTHKIKVSENRRYLVDEATGKPFFYLGDTAWELFHRLTLAEAEEYLSVRAAQGFTVIQAVALAEFNGLTEPNRNGDLPLHNLDPAKPNEAYFAHVDAVFAIAERLGLVMGFLPTWGDKVTVSWGVGPKVLTPANAYTYGKWLGERYKNRDLIWINGGDRKSVAPDEIECWRQLARGLRDGDKGAHLITFHPQGGHSSSEDFHDDVDFNMIQSGHAERDIPNFEMIENDYGLWPTKPCMDAEPAYEAHAINWKAENGYFDDYDVRKSLYWALFAGACGHTYGCHPVWQFLDTARHHAITDARGHWRDALQLPGAWQMRHARALFESRPYLSLEPYKTLAAAPDSTGPGHQQACITNNDAFALVYTPLGEPIYYNLTYEPGIELRASWFDPRTGKMQEFERFVVADYGERTFTPPTSGPGNDWVLMLDDAARGFPLL